MTCTFVLCTEILFLGVFFLHSVCIPRTCVCYILVNALSSFYTASTVLDLLGHPSYFNNNLGSRHSKMDLTFFILYYMCFDQALVSEFLCRYPYGILCLCRAWAIL